MIGTHWGVTKPVYGDPGPKPLLVRRLAFICQLNVDREEAAGAEAEMALARPQRCCPAGCLQVGEEAAATLMPAHNSTACITDARNDERCKVLFL